ncbi:MAG TPA: sulfate adenylyltransferase [Anaerolineae bacterium]|nr:sulfate adenylyltransferase [Anaerolineae bacterium]
MTRTIREMPAHGGTLINRELRGSLREAALERARGMQKVYLSPMSVSDLELIGVGAYSPLTGFMTRNLYESVLEDMRLPNGLAWTIPITLPVPREVANQLREGEEVALVERTANNQDHIMGILELEEKYEYDKEHEAAQVYRTTDDAHPGVARLYRQGDVLLGGNIHLLNRPSVIDFPEFRHDPAQTRRLFAARGWRRIVAFQTRNPIHRAHEYIQKVALEVVDGLFLHPLVGETKEDDIPADVRMESYQAILRDYYPADRVLLGVFPAAMRYAGPREAIFHAICRQNYGCTHFIVGRDHAGVKGYYGTYDAQYIFDEFLPHELAITPLFFEHAFYCTKCGTVTTRKTCPHDDKYHIFLSGTQVRQMLEAGQVLPEEFTRPEVSKILIEGFHRKRKQKANAITPSQQQATSNEQPITSSQQRVHKRRVFVVGLDCADPHLVFDLWRDELPTLSRLMADGAYGRLRSSEPPITVPAWSSMLASKDPGQLGFYGFRNRADYSYERMAIATSLAVKARRVWDVLGQAGKQSIVVGVPQTYPIRPIQGYLISSFLTPPGANYTYPASLQEETEALLGSEYEVDVRNFRTEDKDRLLKDIYRMTEKRFRVLNWLVETKPWDFFMFVEMGVDRIHHGFWKFMDPQHPKYEPGNRFEDAIKDYYVYLDREIGQLLEKLDDDTIVLVVSDHGAKAMSGGFAINQWLIEQGLLVLKHKPDGIVPLEKCEVDWSKTKVWGSGGYYARVFFNVQGRESEGVIPAEAYESFREQIVCLFEGTTDHLGRPLGTVVRIPQQIYREVNNIPPDLIVYFGNLSWRSVGSLGLDAIHTFENDTGPDDANHDWDGILIAYDPQHSLGGRELGEWQLESIAPTILRLMDVHIPSDMEGTAIAL